MRVITITGKAEHGKSEAAAILKRAIENRGDRVFIVNIADQLKMFAKNYLNWNGEKDEYGRTLLQRLGTEKVRSRFPTYWTDRALDVLDIFEEDFDFCIIPDVRMPEEITCFSSRNHSVLSVKVVRESHGSGSLTEEQQRHNTETALEEYEFDLTITASTLAELSAKIEREVIPRV